MCTEFPEVFLNKHWLINKPHNVVNDVLTGLVRSNPHLALLDIGNVIVRRDHMHFEKVKILSGGPSGHEPTYGGFVGQGMLTAAVQGDIYSSPTPNLVLQTIKELSRRHENGILIILQNNINDRLSFGLAMERAENIPNVKIRMIRVDDYIQKSEKRGLIGTILVQKIAGAMSEREFYIHEIYAFCNDLLDNIVTVLVSLKPATSPYYEISSCAPKFKEKELHFGAGLHGQSGFLVSDLISSTNAVEILINHLTDTDYVGSFTLVSPVPVVLVINNLGHSTKAEELIFINEVVSQLQTLEVIIEKIYCGSFLTSLEMAGFSLTVLKLTNPNIMTYLNDPCEAPFWKSFSEIVLKPEISVTISTVLEPQEIQPKPNRGPRLTDNIAKAVENVINFSCGALISCEKQLNILDSETGDSDTGSNIYLPATKIVEYSSKGKLKIYWPFMLFQELSKVLELNARGLQPSMYAIMFEAAAKPFFHLNENDPVTYINWIEAYKSACDACQRYGKINVGYYTMYDSLYASLEVFKRYIIDDAVDPTMNVLDIMGLAALAAEDAAQKTIRPNKEYPDPGAHAVGIWMRATYEALKLHPHLFGLFVPQNCFQNSIDAR